MWSALRADFTEFVSTVKQDTSQALSNLDTGLDPPSGSNRDGTAQHAFDAQHESTSKDQGAASDSLAGEDSKATSDETSGLPAEQDDNVNDDSSEDVDSEDIDDGSDLTPGEVYELLIAADEPFLEPIVASQSPKTDEGTFEHGAEDDNVDDGDDKEETNNNDGIIAKETMTDDDNDDDNAAMFVANFVIDDQTDTISKLLEEHPDTLQATFSRLTSDVTYEEFWKRYFYRCHDEARRMAYFNQTYKPIWQEQQRQQRLLEKARHKRTADGTEPLPSFASVTTFLGGAVKAFVHDDDDDDEDTSAGQAPVQQTPAGALSFFGGNGSRPPFVMNTAVSESGDDDSTNADDEDEEELGWDDDDDDDDFDLDGDNGGNTGSGDEDGTEDGAVDLSRDESQIEFKDVEKEKLKEDLAQAVSEREQLHSTIEMQAKELRALKSGTGANPEVESLKMQLFEKESEIAALKARFEDNDDEDSDSQGSAKKAGDKKPQGNADEVARLRLELEASKSASDGLERQCQELRARLSNEVADETKSYLKELEELQSQLNAMKTKSEQASSALALAESARTQLEGQVESLTVEMNALRATLSESSSQANEVARLMHEKSAWESERANMKAETDKLQLDMDRQVKAALAKVTLAEQSLVQANEDKSSLQNEITVLRQQIAALQSENNVLQSAAKAASENDEISRLKDEIATLAVRLEDTETENRNLRSKLSAAPAAPTDARSSSPGSSSTGVKVSPADTPLPSGSPVVSKLVQDEEDASDGWGDDW